MTTYDIFLHSLDEETKATELKFLTPKVAQLTTMDTAYCARSLDRCWQFRQYHISASGPLHLPFQLPESFCPQTPAQLLPSFHSGLSPNITSSKSPCSHLFSCFILPHDSGHILTCYIFV